MCRATRTDRITAREMKYVAALRASHRMLKHYAMLLNMHDGGERKIPDSFIAFVDRFSEPRITEPTEE